MQSLKKAPITTNIPNDKRPHVELKIADEACVALLDSGAEVSLISQNFFNRIAHHLAPIQPSPHRLRSMHSRLQTNLGIVRANVKYLGYAANLEFNVITDMHKDALMGDNFWKAFQLYIGTKLCDDSNANSPNSSNT